MTSGNKQLGELKRKFLTSLMTKQDLIHKLWKLEIGELDIYYIADQWERERNTRGLS